MKRNSISTFILCLIISTVIISCTKSGGTYGSPTPPPPPPPLGAGVIGMSGSSFSPASVTVKVGETVKWTNNDNVSHTVTSNNGTTFDSGSMAVGTSFSFTPAVAGTFLYHCNFHGGMTGTLTVTN